LAFTRKEYKGECIFCGAETIHWEEIPGPEDDPMDYSFSTECTTCESRNGGHASPRGVVPLSIGSHPGVRISEPLYIFLELSSILGVPTQDGSAGVDHTLERFGRTLREVPGARVVLTSSWVRGEVYDEVLSCFVDKIAKRFIGTTRYPEESPTKYESIRAYLRQNALVDARWVAIDHERDQYPPKAPLVLLDLSTGFAPDAVIRFFRHIGFPSGIGPIITYDHQMERFPLD